MTTAPALPRVREPLRVGGMTLPHRVVMGSMHTGLDVHDDHGEALTAFYAERVQGGAGLIVTGGIAVNDAGRAGPDYAVFTDAADMARWGRAVAGVHAGGGLIAAQLFHAGRYVDPRSMAAPGEPPTPAVAPSAVPWRGGGDILPHVLDDREVRQTVAAFADAAATAVRVGFDAVEIMASEGYLINQFCSPRTNLRADAWGGSDMRRRRFGVAVVRAVRAAVPVGFPVLVRVSGDDLMPGSTTRAQAAAFAVDLADAGADAVSVGVGWHESRVPTVQTAVPSGAWLGVAEGVARALRDAGSAAPVIAANKFIALDEAERALSRGVVDAVALARPFLADPAIVAKTFGGRAELVNPCISCDQACIDQSLFSRPVSCLVNPRAGREAEFPLAGGWSAAPRPGTVGTVAGADTPAGAGGSAAASEAGGSAKASGASGSAAAGGSAAAAGPAALRSVSAAPDAASDTPRAYGVPRARGTLAVVGSGPAGISAALDAARRGRAVVLFERSDTVGGQFRLAARIPGKQTYGAAMDAAVRELRALGADVRLGADVTADAAGRIAVLDDIDDLAGVVLATGVHPRRLALSPDAGAAVAPAGDGGSAGVQRRDRREAPAEPPRVLAYDEALRGPKPRGPVAVIGGGGIGVDVATWLVESESPRTRAATFFERFALAGLADAQTAVAGGPLADAAAPASAGPRGDQRLVDGAPDDGADRVPGGVQHAAASAGAAASGGGESPRGDTGDGTSSDGVHPGDNALDGADVWLFGRNRRLATGVGPSSRWVVLSTLRERGVHLHTGAEAVCLEPGGVRVRDTDGERTVPVATVIVCAGQVAHDPLSAALQASGVPFRVVGGAVDPSGLDAVRAFLHGLRAARALCPDAADGLASA